MTTDERFERVKAILLEAHRVASSGLERIILKMTRKRAPKNWDRVRVLPGVWGRIVGTDADGSYFVDIAVADLLRALENVMLPAVRP